MYLVTIDCGTTNSRVYVVDDKASVIGKATRKVGVRDTAITGSKDALKNGLHQTVLEALENARKRLDEIALVISSGMITSEIGLIEIPHVWAPADMQTLADGIQKVDDRNVFPLEVPIHFVRGIKNRYDPVTTGMAEVGYLDFMRGEETQIAGLLSSGKITLPVNVAVLSSHTKFISIDEAGRIQGSITTMSGQVYEAVIKETFIGKSIRPDKEDDVQPPVDLAIVDMAKVWAEKTGFLRSLLMPRFLDTLIETKWHQRKVFVEAAIAVEDMRAVGQSRDLGFQPEAGYILVGDERRCRIYKHLLKGYLGADSSIQTITDEAEIDSLSIKGSVYLAGLAGLIGR